MKFKRLLKAGEPNPNLGRAIPNLEDAIKKYFNDMPTRPVCAFNEANIRDNRFDPMDGNEIFGFAKDFDEESVEVDLTADAPMIINSDDWYVSFISYYDKETDNCKIVQLAFIKK